MARTATVAKLQAKQSAKVTTAPEHTPPNAFERFAHRTANAVGKPIAFILAVTTVLVWAMTGPLFGFSDTWQLVINTGTTIVTFLMVFLIQQSQNRDTRAVQIKLAELIIAVKGAKNRLATAEDLSEHDLALLHDSYCKLADETAEHLARRRGKQKH
jgi:low affinity Fe/Cu permease